MRFHSNLPFYCKSLFRYTEQFDTLLRMPDSIMIINVIFFLAASTLERYRNDPKFSDK